MSDITVRIDPCEGFEGAERGRLVEACGLLLPWAVLALSVGVEAGEELRDKMAELYQFGIHESVGGSVDRDGVYSYPEDPPMRPLASVIDSEGHEALIYQHAVIAFRDRAGWCYVTRMD